MREKRMKRNVQWIILIKPVEKNNFFFFLALMNSANLSLDVHYSSGAKKNRFSSTAGASF